MVDIQKFNFYELTASLVSLSSWRKWDGTSRMSFTPKSHSCWDDFTTGSSFQTSFLLDLPKTSPCWKMIPKDLGTCRRLWDYKRWALHSIRFCAGFQPHFPKTHLGIQRIPLTSFSSSRPFQNIPSPLSAQLPLLTGCWFSMMPPGTASALCSHF